MSEDKGEFSLGRVALVVTKGESIVDDFLACFD